MATISLRAYNREIAGLIDQGKTEEAIAHCQFILQTYPKHIETYRLLGKAYLESKRNTEAADIFQRILSVLPDDFITHVGMSIVRGDEGNQDAAIWHMERAFEIQPSNAAIQEELRHLYGRRDGTEPAKIRLTRGALVRMYARGNLFQQAITEAKAALQETPQRPDLEVLLAKMYYSSGQKVEATNTCSSILGKYPYCMDANRILAQLLAGTARANDASIYLQRVTACDPYEAFLSPTMSSVADVPDDSVTLEHFIFNPAEKGVVIQNLRTPSNAEFATSEEKLADTIPDWLAPDIDSEIVIPQADNQEQTKKLGAVDAEKESNQSNFEELPSWLTNLEPQDSSTAETQPESSVPEKLEETEVPIPDWMKASGWGPASNAVPETPLPFEGAGTDKPIEPGVLPDWLESLAPPEISQAQSPVDHQPEEPLMKSTEQTAQPDESAMPSSNILETSFPSDAAAGSSLAAVLPESEAVSNQPSELPDWLNEIQSEQPPLVKPTQTSDLDQVLSESAWLSEDKNLQHKDAEMNLPAGSTELPQQPGERKDMISSEFPDWLKSAGIEELPVEGKLGDTSPVSTIKAESPTDFGAEEKSPSATTDEQGLSDWVRQIETEGQTLSAATPAEDGKENILPDWLSEIETPTQEAVEKTTDALKPSTAEALPEGQPVAENQGTPSLSGEMSSEPPSTNILSHTPESAEEEVPEWLRGLESVPEETGVFESTKSEVQPPIEENLVEPVSAEKADEIPDWLKPLAPMADATASVSEPPSDTSGDIPDWLRRVATEDSSRENEPSTGLSDVGSEQNFESESAVSSEPTDFVNQALPDFLQSLVEKPVENQTSLLDESALGTFGISDRGRSSEILPNIGEIQPPAVSSIEPENLVPEVTAETSPEPETPAIPEVSRFANEAESILPPLVQTSYLNEQYEPNEIAAPPDESLEIPATPLEEIQEPSFIGFNEEQTDFSEVFNNAHKALSDGDFQTAQTTYIQLIEERKFIPGIIQDLVEVENRYKEHPDYWELLGDAYGRSQHVQAALDAYTKAEQMV